MLDVACAIASYVRVRKAARATVARQLREDVRVGCVLVAGHSERALLGLLGAASAVTPRRQTPSKAVA
jgi:hypothetical protein